MTFVSKTVYSLSISSLLLLSTTILSSTTNNGVHGFASLSTARTNSKAFIVPQQQQQQRSSASSSTLQMSLVNEALNGYSTFMVNYPLATQSITAGALSGVGDSLAQIQEGKVNDDDETESEEPLSNVAAIVQQQEEEQEFVFDPERTGRFVLKGLGGGLIWSQWYGIADGWSSILCQDVLGGFEVMAGTQTAVRTVIAIALEQFVACPIVYALWDIPLPTVLSGVPAKEVPLQVKSKLGGLLIENAKVWTFVNALIYNIPLEWRILALSTADIFWQAVVSSVTSKDISDDDKDETPTSSQQVA